MPKAEARGLPAMGVRIAATASSKPKAGVLHRIRSPPVRIDPARQLGVLTPPEDDKYTTRAYPRNVSCDTRFGYLPAFAPIVVCRYPTSLLRNVCDLSWTASGTGTTPDTGQMHPGARKNTSLAIRGEPPGSNAALGTERSHPNMHETWARTPRTPCASGTNVSGPKDCFDVPLLRPVGPHHAGPPRAGRIFRRAEAHLSGETVARGGHHLAGRRRDARGTPKQGRPDGMQDREGRGLDPPKKRIREGG
jgi:hypothetical protein